MEKVKIRTEITRNGDAVTVYDFPKGGLFRYAHDGDSWQWWARGEDGIYYRTDENGEGVFMIDQNRNNCDQLTGTDQFSVRGLSEKHARKKILDFMKNHLWVLGYEYEEPMTAEEYANIPNPFEDEMNEEDYMK